jgi:hypothetical protein
LKTVGESGFEECIGLVEINLETLETVGKYGFY